MEVIDSRSGALIVSTPMERLPSFFLDDGYAVHVEPTPDGDMALKVVRYTLHGR